MFLVVALLVRYQWLDSWFFVTSQILAIEPLSIFVTQDLDTPISLAISRCFNSPPTFTATADANLRTRQGSGIAPYFHPAKLADCAVAQEPHGNGLIDSRQNPVPAPVEQVRFPEFAHALGVNLDLPSRRQ